MVTSSHVDARALSSSSAPSVARASSRSAVTTTRSSQSRRAKGTGLTNIRRMMPPLSRAISATPPTLCTSGSLAFVIATRIRFAISHSPSPHKKAPWLGPKPRRLSESNVTSFPQETAALVPDPGDRARGRSIRRCAASGYPRRGPGRSREGRDTHRAVTPRSLLNFGAIWRLVLPGRAPSVRPSPEPAPRRRARSGAAPARMSVTTLARNRSECKRYATRRRGPESVTIDQESYWRQSCCSGFAWAKEELDGCRVAGRTTHARARACPADARVSPIRPGPRPDERLTGAGSDDRSCVTAG